MSPQAAKAASLGTYSRLMLRLLQQQGLRHARGMAAAAAAAVKVRRRRWCADCFELGALALHSAIHDWCSFGVCEVAPTCLLAPHRTRKVRHFSAPPLARHTTHVCRRGR